MITRLDSTWILQAYPIGIPLLFFILVKKYSHILSNQAALDMEAAQNYPNVGHVLFLVEVCVCSNFCSSAEMFVFKSIPTQTHTQAYKPSFYWFEVLECA
jgi:hypothetical protein